MKDVKIYLASPYTHEDPEVMDYRFNQVCEAAGALIQKGFLVFSPIAHTHPIAVVCNLPRHSDFWMKYDRTFIEWCDQLWVLDTDGWRQSRGIRMEVEIARELFKPVLLYGGIWNEFVVTTEVTDEVDKDNRLPIHDAGRGGYNS